MRPPDPAGAETPAARFRESVRRRPDAVAIEVGDERITYAELDARSDALAGSILACAPALDAPVALLVGAGTPAILAILAALKCGPPFAVLDPDYPIQHLRRIVAVARPSLVLTDAPHHEAATELAPDVPIVDIDPSSLVDGGPHLGPVDPCAPASIVFTSGSTGDPKGVVHSHRNLLRTGQNIDGVRTIGADDRYALVLSPGFAAGTTAIFSSLFAGATLLPFDFRRVDVREFPRFVQRTRPTVTYLQPSFLRAVIAALRADECLTTFRTVMVTGEPLAPEDVEQFRRRFATDCDLVYAYASTEANWVAARRIPPGPVSAPIPSGPPVPDLDVVITDEDGSPLPDGAVGEIVVASERLALGYWDDPVRTRARFGERADGARTFRTGDLGRSRDDGTLEVVGRLDARVKVRGHTVETDAVARALADLPEVAQAVVTTAEAGAGDRRLVAYVVTSEGARPSARTLRQGLAAALPSFMIPNTFVRVDALPLNARGKIDRVGLRELATRSLRRSAAYAAPRSAAESTLAALYAEILGAEEVGRDDDFFDLGGDSLDALELLAGVEERLGIDVPPSMLLEAPTPASFACALELGPIAPTTMVRLEEGPDERAPIFLVAGGGEHAETLRRVARHLDERTVYGLQAWGLEHHARPDRTVMRAAQRQLAEIRRVQPSGPYLLGGHSAGGVIAFEMAQRLRAVGEDVPLVVLLDTAAPGGPRTTHMRRQLGKRRDRIDEQHRPGLRRTLAISGAAIDVTRRAARIRWRAMTAGVVPRTGARRRSALLGVSRSLTRRHRPLPYEGRVLLLRASDEVRATYDERWRAPDRGWGALLAGPTTFEDVPGNHASMVSEPHAGPVAAAIDRALRALDA